MPKTLATITISEVFSDNPGAISKATGPITGFFVAILSCWIQV